jgi:RNA recognition motif-containing protein
MDIFAGSLPFKLSEEDLKKLFEQYGEVNSAKIIIDKVTRQNKGYGFVEMPNDNEATKAIEALDGFEVLGRNIVVNKSEKKEDRSDSRKSNDTRRDSSRNNTNTTSRTNTTSNNSGDSNTNFGANKVKGGGYSNNKGGGYNNSKGGFNKGKSGGFNKGNKRDDYNRDENNY